MVNKEATLLRIQKGTFYFSDDTIARVPEGYIVKVTKAVVPWETHVARKIKILKEDNPIIGIILSELKGEQEGSVIPLYKRIVLDALSTLR